MHRMSAVPSRIRVLHVDDEPMFAETAAEFLERADDRLNPVTDTSYAVSYHRGVESPMVTYRPLSGEQELYESRGTPSEVLRVAADLTGATTDALDVAMDNEYSVNTEELSALIDRREELETELSRLRDQLDELRRTPVDE